MKLKRFKERDNKRIGIIVFTISCILLVSGVILYRTFAIFEVRTNQNVINGTVQDPGDIYFAFYQKNEDSGDYEIQRDMPNKENGYVLDEEKSYCGVNGEKNSNIKVSVNEDWKIIVSGVTTSRTKCNLYFTKGIFIMGHGVPVVTNGDGLYEVKHENVQNTLNDNDFKKTEYRYAGKNPKNYITFNNEPWRIIGLVNVMTNETQVEQRIKIVKDTNIGNFVRDINNTNNWVTSSLMVMLNGIYYNSEKGECYPKNGAAETCDFQQSNGIKGLNSISREMVDKTIFWNIGGSETYTDVLTNQFYERERGTNTGNGNAYPTLWSYQNSTENTFNGIGLIYPSDFGYATSGGTLGKDTCLEKTLYFWNSFPEIVTECIQNDWLTPKVGYEWALTPVTKTDHSSFAVHTTGFVSAGNDSVLDPKPTRPSLYLKPNVKIYDGNGTEENPFQLKQEIFE